VPAPPAAFSPSSRIKKSKPNPSADGDGAGAGRTPIPQLHTGFNSNLPGSFGFAPRWPLQHPRHCQHRPHRRCALLQSPWARRRQPYPRRPNLRWQHRPHQQGRPTTAPGQGSAHRARQEGPRRHSHPSEQRHLQRRRRLAGLKHRRSTERTLPGAWPPSLTKTAPTTPTASTPPPFAPYTQASTPSPSALRARLVLGASTAPPSKALAGRLTRARACVRCKSLPRKRSTRALCRSGRFIASGNFRKLRLPRLEATCVMRLEGAPWDCR
jgi:hypothetical protein